MHANQKKAIFLAFFAVIALSFSIAYTVCEADCDGNCQESSGESCACICCPNILMMSQSNDNSVQVQYDDCLWVVARPDLLGEQEWFTNIDHPPQNIS